MRAADSARNRSLGVLLFEMCCGWSPFYAEDTQQMYKLMCVRSPPTPASCNLLTHLVPCAQLLWQSQVPSRRHWRRRQTVCQGGTSSSACVAVFVVLTPVAPLSQLLNRNPKHRLGATRDAAELKEHAFFKSIDWEHLAARQIPPPFKPYVDSDESVANFDPEFTEANLMDEAPVDVNFDEDDPSADWLDQASRSARMSSSAAPMEIRAQRRPPLAAAAPLTSSVQENFRALPSVCFPRASPCAHQLFCACAGGFTFSGEGESMIHHAAGLFATTHIHPPDSPKQSDQDDEWEDDGDAVPTAATAGSSDIDMR